MFIGAICPEFTFAMLSQHQSIWLKKKKEKTYQLNTSGLRKFKTTKWLFFSIFTFYCLANQINEYYSNLLNSLGSNVPSPCNFPLHCMECKGTEQWKLGSIFQQRSHGCVCNPGYTSNTFFINKVLQDCCIVKLKYSKWVIFASNNWFAARIHVKTVFQGRR